MFRLTINIIFGVAFGVAGYLLYGWIGTSNLKQEYVNIAYGIAYFCMIGSGLSLLQSFVLFLKKGPEEKKIEPTAQKETNFEALSRLGELKEKGLLTEEEFEREKRKILGK